VVDLPGWGGQMRRGEGREGREGREGERRGGGN